MLVKTNEEQIQTLQLAFEQKCDEIQRETEALFKKIPASEWAYRDKVMLMHHKKLSVALQVLQQNLAKIVINQ